MQHTDTGGVEVIAKISNIMVMVAKLTDQDIENIMLAKERIKEVARTRGGLDQTDKDGLNRLDAIVRLYQVLPDTTIS